MKKHLTMTAFLTLASMAQGQESLLIDQHFETFASAPDTCRTKLWWFHGEVAGTCEGITADLEAFKEAGVGGVVYYDQVHGDGATAEPLFSPDYWKLVKHAAKEAKRLGLSFEINITNGYVGGGPWITPDNAMKYVATEELTVQPGQTVTERDLPRPGGHYAKDIALLAIPLKELPTNIALNNVNATEAGHFNLATGDKPLTLRSLTCTATAFSKGPQSIMNVPCLPTKEFSGDRFALTPSPGELEASNDGETWWTVCALPPSYRQQSLVKGTTVSFPAVTARHFRLHLHDWMPKEAVGVQPMTISNLRLSSDARIDHWEGKAAYTSNYIEPSLTPTYRLTEAIDPKSIVQLTEAIDGQGRFSFTVTGKHPMRLIRFASAPRGATKHGRQKMLTATGDTVSGHGYECDKLNRAAAHQLWNGFAQRMLDTLTAIGCKPEGVVMDSHEAGEQNWTEGFDRLFEQRNGYSPLPYLPAMRGYVVGNVEQTERFLADLRRTVADGIADSYFNELQHIADSCGVTLTAQAMGNGQSICSDNIMSKGRVRKPQGEFWARMHNGAYDIKEASCALHLYGGQLASAEAFTDLTYDKTLGDIRDEADMAAAFHVGELVVCASAAQPRLDRIPGNTANTRQYCLNRNNTMWPLSRGFFDYQARNSYMQRQGEAVVDVLVYAGDDAPMKLLAHRLPLIPEGYDFDVCTTDALLHRQASIRNHYKAIVIEKGATVPAKAKEALEEYAKAGMLIHDDRNPSRPLAEALLENGIRPDLQTRFPKVKTAGSLITEKLYFNHHRLNGADSYFICNHTSQPFADTLLLRTPYAVAEYWDADQGSRYRLPAEQTADGLKVALTLTAGEAGYVVTMHNSTATPKTTTPRRVTELSKPWTVQFDTLLGGPSENVTFNELTDWTQSANPAIKHFSGLATYTTTVELKKEENESLWLQLPKPGGVARVKVNGKDAGIVWTTPYQADITDLVRQGENTVEIEVRNTLNNRMIGDAALPKEERRTWSSAPLYKSSDALTPSGLIGKVSVLHFAQE